jgi:hypothetical protein
MNEFLILLAVIAPAVFFIIIYAVCRTGGQADSHIDRIEQERRKREKQ